MIDRDLVHERARGRWPDLLVGIGIDPEALTGRHTACPGCGGRDCFRFDDRDGRGTWLCSKAGRNGKPLSSDGFGLLQHVLGWSFPEALRAVAGAVGVTAGDTASYPRSKPVPQDDEPEAPASPTPRVKRLLATSTTPDLVDDARAYLTARHLWPLPQGCTLRAHVGLEFWDAEAKANTGRYPVLVAEVRDADGERVTAHVTFLDRGWKLDHQANRKILGPVRGRRAPAVRLMPLGESKTLAIGEGIETCLAGAKLLGHPAWSALNAGLLTKFEPPPGVERIVILTDADPAGIEAAGVLQKRLLREHDCDADIAPPPSGKDWHDALESREAEQCN